MSLTSYSYGYLALGGIYALSFATTRSPWPWALARGNNKVLSTSLLQFLAFTALTVFAYSTATAARFLDTQIKDADISIPQVPLNLLFLMGLSVATATGSKGLTISYFSQNQLNPNQDQSSLTTNRQGETDLIKTQMLIWTAITIVIYVAQLSRYISGRGYAGDNMALPDIDGALLVLMGVSQGGYIAGKVVSRTVALPTIEHLLPQQAKAGDEVTAEGLFFSDEKGTLILRDPKNLEKSLTDEDILSWSDTQLRFKVPANQELGNYQVKIRTAGKTSEPINLIVIK
jgi:hypothetical protein